MLTVALAALAGGLVSALLGWVDSKEPFAVRKFVKSLLVSLVAAVAFALSYAYSDGVGLRDGLVAFLAGAGADVLANRLGLGKLGKSPGEPPSFENLDKGERMGHRRDKG